MLTLFPKILFCVLLASALGFAFAWWLRRRLSLEQLAELRMSGQRALSDERSRSANLDEEGQRLAREADQLRSQLNAAAHAAMDAQAQHKQSLERAKLDLQRELTESFNAQLSQANAQRIVTQQTGSEIKSEQPIAVQALDDLRATHKKDLTQLTARLLDSDKRYTARTVELNQAREALEQANQQLNALREKQAQLSADVLPNAPDESARQKLRESSERNNALQAELNDIRAEFAALRLHVSQKDQTIDNLRSELGSHSARLEAATIELMDREARLSQRQMEVANHDMETANLRNQVQVLESNANALAANFESVESSHHAETERLREEILRREQTLADRQAIVTQYEREVAGLMAQRDRAQTQLSELQTQVESRVLHLQEQIEQTEQHATNLKEQLIVSKQQFSDFQLSMAELEAKHSEDRSQWELRFEEQRRRALHAEEETQRAAETWKEATEAEHEAITQNNRLRAELQSLAEQRQGLQLQHDGLRAEYLQLRRDLEQKNSQLREIELALEHSRVSQVPHSDGQLIPAWRAERPAEIDDLQQIWGVGPKLEQLLHSLGIWTFRQIASWTQQDIVEVDGELQVFHGRIERDGWVNSAREAHFRKYGVRL